MYVWPSAGHRLVTWTYKYNCNKKAQPLAQNVTYPWGIMTTLIPFCFAQANIVKCVYLMILKIVQTTELVELSLKSNLAPTNHFPF